MSLNNKCQVAQNNIDVLLNRTEDVVNYAESNIDGEFDSLGSVRNKKYRQKITKKILSIFKNGVITIDGIKTFYLHYNEDLTGEKDGFWYVKGKNDQYHAEELTEATAYRDDQTKWNAWYYQPLKARGALWLSPYYNANLGINMISYVVPFYVMNQFIGVVGADISFSTLHAYADDVRPYKNSKALLTDAHFRTLVEDATVSSKLEFTFKGNKNLLKKSSTNLSLINGTYHHQASSLAFRTLRNGMHILVVVPHKEIFAERYHALAETMFMTFFLVAIFIAIVLIFVQKLISPLTQLTHAARQVALGNYDIHLNKTTNDEIGTLTDALNKSISAVDQSMNRAFVKAYQDELTKVKNYNAYEVKMLEMDEKIKRHQAHFGVVMADMNQLKLLNDRYGHEQGNCAIKTMATAICHIYKHSPVYRVGGDEFVVILEGEDYYRHHYLFSRLQTFMKKRDMSQPEPWLEIAFSAGEADYDHRTDHSFKDVSERADTKMYACKKALKAERTEE